MYGSLREAVRSNCGEVLACFQNARREDGRKVTTILTLFGSVLVDAAMADPSFVDGVDSADVFEVRVNLIKVIAKDNFRENQESKSPIDWEKAKTIMFGSDQALSERTIAILSAELGSQVESARLKAAVMKTGEAIVNGLSSAFARVCAS
jgi:hypothetical protein